MTYPPQQPGQGGPYGQQPGWGQPQPGQYGQQPGGQFPPSGPQQPGYGQQFPPSGPQQPSYGQQFPPSGPQQQQPAWGQQPGGQYPQTSPYPGWDGQQQAWGQQPGFGGTQPPKKSKTGLIVGIAIAAVVLLTGGGIGIYFATSGPGDPRAVAEEIAREISAKNFVAVKDNVCRKNQTQMQDKIKEMSGQGSPFSDVPSRFQDEVKKALKNAKINVKVGKVTRNGDKATAQMEGSMHAKITILGTTKNIDRPMNGDMEMIVEDGAWKTCGMG